jgi:hypothetical protein
MSPEVWSTAKNLLEFFVSAAGLSVVVVFVTQLAKKYLKWEDAYAKLLAVGSAAVVGVLAFFALQYELYSYVEQYWPLVVAFIGAVTYGGSQLLYSRMPTRGNGE